MSPLHELQRLLLQRDLRIFFQPIQDTRQQRVLGYEALARGPATSPLHGASDLFAAARHHHMLADLENLCRELAVTQFLQHRLPGKLFLNVSPQSLTDPALPYQEIGRLLAWSGLAPSRVVLELSEQDPAPDLERLIEATRHYAALGCGIAIDDLGAGYSGLRLWSEIRPHYVKIDRHFVDNIHRDDIKREFVEGICGIARRLGCVVIAEGIERVEESDLLQALDIHHLQGFHLGRPAPAATLSE